MHAPTRVEIARRETETFQGHGGLLELPSSGAASRHSWQDKFSDNAETSSELAPRDGIQLTDRECTILQLLSHGYSNKEAAKWLGISPETVKSHLKNIFQKLCVDRRTQAVSRALGLGVITAS